MPESAAELLTRCLIELDRRGETVAAAHVDTAIHALKDKAPLSRTLAAPGDPQAD